MGEAGNRSASPLEVDASSLADALDSLHEGLQILSPEFRYLYVNDAVARQGRKRREELLGRTMSECYPGLERTQMYDVLQRCMRERRSETIENEFAYDDGKSAWFELRIRPCAAGLVIASVDMTERKGVEQRLDAAYHQALLDLATPVIRVHRGVLLVPLIGAIGPARAAQATEVVLGRVAKESAKVVILDVSGLAEMDTSVAQHVLQTAEMLRLLGASVVLTGIGAASAKTMVHLGIDLAGMKTTHMLADGIELALAQVGRAITAR